MELLPNYVSQAVVQAARAGVPQPDGWTLARLPIESQAHAVRDYLRLSPGVEVLEPASLRDRMVAVVRELAATYRDSG